MEALGLIEVIGYITAIEAADAALKAANIKLLNITKVGSGIMTVIFNGDVSAIKSAVESGREAAERIGKIRSVHVIASADNSLEKFIQKKGTQNNKQKTGTYKISIIDNGKQDEKVDLSSEPIKAVTYAETAASVSTEVDLKSKTNSELRSMALNMGIKNEEIKNANKSDLIQMIINKE